jgi:chorismate dehydratase
VGRISALNMYPVYHGLERLAGPGLEFTDGLPTTLNDALLEDRLDVSCMSSIAYARNAGRLRLIPVASISCEGTVDSIQVFSRVPFDRVRSVAVTPASASSVALLRILLPDGTPPFRPLRGDPRAALAEVDAVLLIADEALESLRAGWAPYATDLGERWRERTGLPMVFAVWAAREEVARARPADVRALARMLATARGSYLRDPDPVVAAAAARFPFPEDYVRRYLGRLSYGFGPPERAGLARFLELAAAAGELDRLPSLAA